MRYDISHITLSGDGAVIEFMDPFDDIRSNGMSSFHQLVVPGHLEEVADELEALHQAAEALLKKARVSYLEATPGAPAAAQEAAHEDEGPGPYDHPEGA